MKKITSLLSIILVFALLSTCLFACTPSGHEHEFVETSRTVTCTEAGTISYECSCGKKKTEKVDALGHNYVEVSRTVTCTKAGTISYECVCGLEKTEDVAKLGHNFGEQTSYARIPMCQNPGCKISGSLRKSESDFRDSVTYTFTEADKERIQAKFQSLKDILAGYGDYDATAHAYVEGSEWDTKNEEYETAMLEYEDEIYFVIAQYQYAKIQSDVDFYNEDKQAIQLEISNYYDAVLADYNSLFGLVHKSPLREYFYYGMTQEEIDELLEEAENASDPRIVELSNRNNEIETEYNAIANPEANASVLDLYAEFVSNNNQIAQIKGYDNYMDYAYDRIYGREYTPDQIESFYQNVKEYIVPLFQKYEKAWSSNQKAHSGSNQYTQFVDFYDKPFFSYYTSNKAVNDFLTTIKTTDSEGNAVSYQDYMEDLMENKNYFRGDYSGAYSWYLRYLETPILYFGTGSNNAQTVVHEFGHYANELKNYDYSQSFDLSETHSQGLEVLFLSYLNANKSGLISQTVYDLYSSYNFLNNLWITCIAAGVDAFERAVYTNEYTGESADEFLADGVISKDEYDALFTEIMAELGCQGYETYWRLVTIRSAGYYISYSVSMACSLQLFSNSENYDANVQAYLKLVNYTDIEEQQEFTYKQVLEYAGLKSYDDEELFKIIRTALAN